VIAQTEALSAWIGRSETVHDSIYPTPVVALTATLDHPAAPVQQGSTLPPLWHWLYFLPMHQQSEIGADGHAKRGAFLPPVPLPRRMWAGSQFEFRSPIRVGDRVARTSTIDDVSIKEGRTGKLVFVKVRHEVRCNEVIDPALVEFHDIVYLHVSGDPQVDGKTIRLWASDHEGWLTMDATAVLASGEWPSQPFWPRSVFAQ